MLGVIAMCVRDMRNRDNSVVCTRKIAIRRNEQNIY